jgi:hypothetical protein
MAAKTKRVSSGHKLGQVIGDWWEEHVILPLLAKVAADLDLWLDCRFVKRSCRTGSKILWNDIDGNAVDYDFVLEAGGSDKKRGVPVAFIESFWRRGARHSKDKARDDTNKLLPMRNNYPTARFLSIAACGEFTEPAREYVRTRDVDLFYIPKANIVEAFKRHHLIVDYADTLPEDQKEKLMLDLEQKFVGGLPSLIGQALGDITGRATMKGYSDRISAALSALPVSIEITESLISDSIQFKDTAQVSKFLINPSFKYSNPQSSFKYKAEYSDGSTFETDFISLPALKEINGMVADYVDHISRVMQ